MRARCAEVTRATPADPPAASATTPLASPSRTTPRSRAVRRITTRADGSPTTIRTRLPRSLPGSRRYGHL